MICQPVTLSGYAEWPKVADAVIEAQLLAVEIPLFLRQLLSKINVLMGFSSQGDRKVGVIPYIPAYTAQ